MSTLEERLSAALAPRYRLGDEVGSGGMARVFRAEDTTLARPVAVKVLRPELATAVGAERFLREARALAAVSHPNVMTIHECGEADGILYYVMDFETAPSLRTCLDRGPCDEEDAWRVGVDLLAALAATHERGVIHRDVKPGNIFLRSDRAVLADFGIARDVAESDTPLTEEGAPGTPEYMAPEQALGRGSTERSDIYSAGLVLYEAFTGRRWPGFQDPERADWTSVPRRARPALKRALDPDPDRRWGEAAVFREALRKARSGRPVVFRAAVAALTTLAVFLAWWSWQGSSPAAGADLAVLPCRPSPGVDPEAARAARSYAASELDNLRGIFVLSETQTLNTWDRYAIRQSADDWAAWTGVLGARWVSDCRITAEDGSWRVSAELHDGIRSEGPYTRTVESSDPTRVGQALFHALLEGLGAERLIEISEDEAGVLSEYSSEAVLQWIDGKENFRQDALRDAERNFEQALALEPEFALAEWHLAETQRWLAYRAVEVDLGDLYARGASHLPVRDSMLLAARIAPYETKLDMLRAASERFPDEAYPTLVYADEMYHRGGLWGEPVDSALALFESAVHKDPSLAPALEHLAQAQIRLGRRSEAERSLAQLGSVSGPPDQHDVYYPLIWDQAWLMRFGDDQEAGASFERLASILGPDGMVDLLRLGCRWVRYVELPSGQVMLGSRLLDISRQNRSPSDAARGLLAMALGEIGQGRIESALAALDAIAVETRTAEARVQATLQAAEWRVIPYSLGLAGFEEAEAEAGVLTLAEMWSDRGSPDVVRARSAFGLAVFAARSGRSGEAGPWLDSLRALEPALGQSAVSRKSLLVDGLALAAAGDPAAALARTDTLVAYDSVALGEDPFSRASTYWLRARWQAAAGDTAAALRILYWHENTDLEEGTIEGLVQAAEVDAAFGVHARAMTVELAGGLSGDEPVAGLPRCYLIRTRGEEVLRLWSDPDPAILPLRDQVAAVLQHSETECVP